MVLVFVVRNGGHLWKSEEVGNVPTPDDPTPTFNPADLPPKKELKVTPIPRIPAGSLSVKEFYEQAEQHLGHEPRQQQHLGALGGEVQGA